MNEGKRRQAKRSSAAPGAREKREREAEKLGEAPLGGYRFEGEYEWSPRADAKAYLMLKKRNLAEATPMANKIIGLQRPERPPEAPLTPQRATRELPKSPQDRIFSLRLAISSRKGSILKASQHACNMSPLGRAGAPAQRAESAAPCLKQGAWRARPPLDTVRFRRLRLDVV